MYDQHDGVVCMTTEDPRISELRALREKARLGGGLERIATQHETYRQRATGYLA